MCHGAEVNKNDRWGGTAIRDAEAGGHRSVVEYLERNGAIRRPSRVEDESVPSPDDLVDMTGKLCDAARNGDVVKLRELLDAGAEVVEVTTTRRPSLGRPGTSRGQIFLRGGAIGAVDAAWYPSEHKQARATRRRSVLCGNCSCLLVARGVEAMIDSGRHPRQFDFHTGRVPEARRRGEPPERVVPD